MKRQGLLLRACVMVIVFLMGVGCLHLAPTLAKAVDNFEVVKTPEFEGVIIPRERTKDFMKAFSNIEEKESWTPSKAEVLKLEEGIESYLKKAAAKKSPKLWSKLAPYKRQYVGLMRNNRRVIFANFFCNAFDVDWKNTAVAVLDGGDCFFTVVYDVERGSFDQLQINGEA
jgi:hypothetical protein